MPLYRWQISVYKSLGRRKVQHGLIHETLSLKFYQKADTFVFHRFRVPELPVPTLPDLKNHVEICWACGKHAWMTGPNVTCQVQVCTAFQLWHCLLASRMHKMVPYTGLRANVFCYSTIRRLLSFPQLQACFLEDNCAKCKFNLIQFKYTCEG